MNNAEFLRLAQDQADAFSTCSKVQVGSLIRTDKYFNIFGYNRGVCNCRSNGCRRIKLYGENSKLHRLPSDCDSIHSEIDAISKAAAAGISTYGSTIYVTRYPCEACARAICVAGIHRVVYGRKEEISEYTKQIFDTYGVEVIHEDWEEEDNNA